MNTLEVKINSTNFVLFFGFLTFKKLGDAWGLKGYKEVLEKLASTGDVSEDITFEQFTAFATIIVCAIGANAEKQPEITLDEVLDFLISNTQVIGDVVMKLMEVTQKPQNDEVVPGKKLVKK